MTAETFIQRLSSILAALAALVAARLLHHPTLARHIVPLWTYLRHVPLRVERALAHPPRPRPSHPRAPLSPAPLSPESPSRAEERAPRSTWRLPTSPVWLIRVLGYQGAGYASQLRALLAEPGAQALLAASPAAQRRLVPLLRILIPSQWGNPLPCAQRPTPKPCAPQPASASPVKTA